jgi:hypothetical protein
MRMLIALAVAVVIAAVSFGVRTIFIPGPVDQTLSTSETLSPHEMHLNYKAMKELPVREVKEPF